MQISINSTRLRYSLIHIFDIRDLQTVSPNCPGMVGPELYILNEWSVVSAKMFLTCPQSPDLKIGQKIKKVG